MDRGRVSITENNELHLMTKPSLLCTEEGCDPYCYRSYYYGELFTLLDVFLPS